MSLIKHKKLILAITLSITAIGIFVGLDQNQYSTTDITTLPRSTDFMMDDDVSFHYFMPQESALGNSYKTISTLSNDSEIKWKTGYTSLPKKTDQQTIQLDVLMESYDQMPEPSQKVLDKYLKKLDSPKKRITPFYLPDENQSTIIPSSAMKVDDTLDVDQTQDKKKAPNIESKIIQLQKNPQNI